MGYAPLEIVQSRIKINTIIAQFIPCSSLITCGYGLFFYPDMEETFVAIAKKLKKGGLFVFSSFTEKAFSPYAELFLQRLEKEYQIETPKLSKDRLKTEKSIQSLAQLIKPQKVQIEIYPIRYQMTIDDWWAMLNNAGYKSLLDQLNPQALTQFKKDHLAEFGEIKMAIYQKK